MTKSKQNYNLLVVAHPDDETIFFGGLIQQLRTHPWHVVCVTDANADGFGQNRYKQFATAMKKLKVKKFNFFDLPDIYEKRLDQLALQQKLATLTKPNAVYTHGPIGEYGHPHHQDVCFAVNSVFLKTKVYGVAYNCVAEKKIVLTNSQLKNKCEILSNIYGSETKRFINFLPATYVEGFSQFSMSEVSAIYKFFVAGDLPTSNQLKFYKWFEWYFKNKESQFMPRPF